MKLFKAICETDLSLVGAFPQISSYSVEGRERPYDDFWRQRAEAAESFRMSGDMSVKAIRTQVLSCLGVSPGRGLIIENAVVAGIRSYLPPSCMLNPFTVNDLMNDSVHPEYGFLEVRTTSELFSAIDFAKSSFYLAFFDEYQEDIAISSRSEWEAKQAAENAKGTSLSIEPKTVALRRDFLATIGVLKFPFDGRIFFTEPVARIIEKAKPTGIRLIEERGIALHPI